MVRFNAHCIKINSTLTSTLGSQSRRGLSIQFKNETNEEDASDTVFVFFTSEENSYGAESYGKNLHSKYESNFSLIMDNLIFR